MTTTSTRLRAAPLVALVVGFAAVFAIGLRLGPSTDSTDQRGPGAAVPSTSAPAGPTENRVEGPDADGNVDLGVVRRGTTFAAGNRLDPVVMSENDRLTVCVTVPAGTVINSTDWMSYDDHLTGLRRYCSTPAPGTKVGFRLEGR